MTRLRALSGLVALLVLFSIWTTGRLNLVEEQAQKDRRAACEDNNKLRDSLQEIGVRIAEGYRPPGLAPKEVQVKRLIERFQRLFKHLDC
jgi:hypothetical protein